MAIVEDGRSCIQAFAQLFVWFFCCLNFEETKNKIIGNNDCLLQNVFKTLQAKYLTTTTMKFCKYFQKVTKSLLLLSL